MATHPLGIPGMIRIPFLSLPLLAQHPTKKHISFLSVWRSVVVKLDYFLWREKNRKMWT
jgi:hypothetical protein